MNDLFTQTSALMNEAKHRHGFEQNVEQEFILIS